jgi:hypothetical protein
MNGFWLHIDDIAAMLIVLAGLVLLGLGVDSDVKSYVGIGVAYLFGKNSPALLAKLNIK